jgi:hypothetical protein
MVSSNEVVRRALLAFGAENGTNAADVGEVAEGPLCEAQREGL